MAIDRIGEECVETVLGGLRCDIEAEVPVVSRAGEHLLAPVAKDVCTKGWVGLGAVVEGAVVEMGKGKCRARSGKVVGRSCEGFL